MSVSMKTKSRYSRIWAAVREMGISSDELHDVLYRDYQKSSLKELTDHQVDKLGTALWDMALGRPSGTRPWKRTDEGGRSDNANQRRKIFMLAGELGWSEASINKFAFAEYGVSRHEWLPPEQCSQMIEAMKAIVKREKSRTS